jgi:hypothetical protein
MVYTLLSHEAIIQFFFVRLYKVNRKDWVDSQTANDAFRVELIVRPYEEMTLPSEYLDLRDIG